MPLATPTPLTSDEIRLLFVRFWQERGSVLAPSASVIPHNDPTVLFTIAGMQQFVPYFLGHAPSPESRYVSIQKCFRTVDIDEVGDPRHLTFFEMMGNFSIGDYFKEEVIPWAFELVTQRFGMPLPRLWITVHETDDEADSLWRAQGIPPQRIVRRGDADNWWGPPGKSGPCGPDSEIYYQQDAGHGCGFPGDPPDCDCGRLEFWNLVFMQYFQDEQGTRTPLARRNVDTGIGLERTAALLQGTPSIYESDLFLPIIRAAAGVAGVSYGGGGQLDYALRVLADHGRGMVFLVADGVVPGATGREYVLRRIVRRAITWARRIGIDGPFLGHLIDAVIQRMQAHYPELQSDRARIRQVLDNEEELFSRTLRAGWLQVERLVAEAQAQGTVVVDGARVFDLFQTYGFPSELTEELLHEHGLSFERSSYEASLTSERNRARSRAAFRQAQRGGANQFPQVPETEFLAWTELRAETRVVGLAVDGGHSGRTESLQSGQSGRIVLEASPFYPEGGGQVGDTGRLALANGELNVEDTQVDGAGHVVHIGRVISGHASVGDLARADVDVARRFRIMRHHTATHLLHRALKDVLGEGTSQQGSLVSPDLARFDFNYPRPLTPDQLNEVSRIVNDQAMGDLPVHWEIQPIDQARRSGAVMMFGEKYGEQVRVVSIGDYSRELCGGTHAHHAGQLGLTLVASETGIGSGKRRIVAHSGTAALRFYGDRVAELERLIERLGARGPDDALQRIDALLADLEGVRGSLDRLQREKAQGEVAGLLASVREVQGVRVLAQVTADADDDTLKQLVDSARERLGSGVVCLASSPAGRPRYVTGVTPDLVGRLDAARLLKEVARIAGGGGGGRPDFATGGGGDPSRLPAAVERTFAAVASALASAEPTG